MRKRGDTQGAGRGVVGGSFKYIKSSPKIGMFPMTPVKGRVEASRIAHRIKSPMGWGCRPSPELPHEAVSRKGGWNGRSSALKGRVGHNRMNDISISEVV